MSTRNDKRRVERWFDGESDVKNSGPESAAYLEYLQRTRSAVASIAESPGIGDARMGEFLRGIRDEIESPRRGWSGMWALASAAAAAVVVAISIMFIVIGGPSPAQANTVDAVGSEISGATTSVDYESDGTATVWVTLPESDLW